MVLNGIKGRIEQNISLKTLSTWKIGGTAEWVVWPNSVAELETLWRLAQESQIPIRLIGRGSNLLFPDEGLEGITVVSTALTEEIWGEYSLQAEAGCSIARLAQEAAERGFSGLEFARGIPGTLGGAIVMNAGAHGGEIQNVLHKVTVLTEDGKLATFNKEDLIFGYRECSLRGKAWILAAELKFTPGNKETIKAQMAENLAKRKSAQPLELPNAGSIFRNPPGDSAGRLIEQTGWKGKGIGGAQVSAKHANFIVNRGNATAADVLALIEAIQKDVFEKYGVKLQTEVHYMTS
ncbi:UDP-N-acetylmuramate dehydrogenase [Desulfitobacterium sp.]|uniref:UDP-N-acetylmuramate dehydrogenase n=1 Tax=Desulfitobacterium sp. TaxID=49981 RepID=UPI002B1EEC71|nr:UDP-N-acetylmuramate dehydrogenase [Desulfitobacterium sp.]MEA4900056.1 UDP-N-acetylmuramate dehydrogenase [Desulfitobacterium sp.]